MIEEQQIVVFIGHAEADYVKIEVLGRNHPGATDSSDLSWLLTPIEISAGGFSASIGAVLRVQELSGFKAGLEALDQALSGCGLLESCEGWIRLEISADRRGSISISGTAIDTLGSANKLAFIIRDVESSNLREAIRALERVEARYAVAEGDGA